MMNAAVFTYTTGPVCVSECFFINLLFFLLFLFDLRRKIGVLVLKVGCGSDFIHS